MFSDSMPLEEYQKKRRFDKTPEPTGGTPDNERLHFVIQKHQATHLHYDFRLELKGVLKSWAVPKGPSMNPDDHRLAQAVEDHPYDYKDFEGIIPKGQYGGGTVIIWDEGTYEPAEKFSTKKEKEHWLMSNYYKGAVRIRLAGSKLKGEFELVKKRERGENSWVLSKIADRHALKTDVLKKDRSVVSGMTLEEMADNPEARQWQSNRSAPPKVDIDKAIRKGVKSAMPLKVEPTLSTLIEKPFNDDDWLYEVKFDGYRIITFVKKGKKPKLQSRGLLDFTSKYPLVEHELTKLSYDVVLDGEVVALDEDGLPDFEALQSYNGRDPIAYYVFDLLWINGYDLTGLPLTERRAILEAILPKNDVILYSRDFPDGVALFELIRGRGMEGIVIKRKDSRYQAGRRTQAWLKVRTTLVEDFVVGGWTESDSNRAFRSLIFGTYRDGKLTYVGHAGGGFKENEMAGILERLKPLEVKICPFEGTVDTSTAPHWVKPELVVRIKYATKTRAGNIRKPATFLGFVDDKKAGELIREAVITPEEAEPAAEEREAVEDRGAEVKKEKKAPKVKKRGVKAAEAVETAEDSNWPDIEKLEVASEGQLPIEGHDVRVTNLEKVLWSDHNINKAALLNYYISVSPYLLPYLKDRPLSLHLKPYSPTAPGLYIKDMEGREPAFAEVFPTPRKVKKKGKRNMIDYLVCQNLATLVYIVNLGAIDLNPWNSRTIAAGEPDFIVIDLDPSDDDFSKVIETAKAAREVFDKYRLTSFIKTSGKTGMHLLLPCRGVDHSGARAIAENLAKEIHALLPAITTTEMSIAKRGSKLYIDPNQNDFSDTIASAYSVRPFHIPAVSTPLEWKEVNAKLDPGSFMIGTVLKRIAKKGDLWNGMFDESLCIRNTGILREFL